MSTIAEQILPVTPEGIPAELIARRQWVVWRLTARKNGKPTKRPYQTDGRLAESDNPTTWTTFEAALATYQRGGYSGIGYVFTADDPYVGIDLDDCIDPDPDQGGALLPWAQQIIDRLGTYAEISPSGTGVKLWARGTLATEATGRKRPYQTGAVEMYHRVKYFAMTGDTIPCCGEIVEAQDGIDWLWATALADKPHERARPPKVAHDDDLGRIVDRARKYIAKKPPAIDGEGGSDQTFDAACALVLGFALTPEQAYPLMVEYSDRCVPPWSEKEIWHKLADADKKPQERGYLRDAERNGYSPTAKKNRSKAKSHDATLAEPTAVVERVSAYSAIPSVYAVVGQTDKANARRYVALHGDSVRWCDQWNKWLVWDDARWAPDVKLAAQQRAKTVSLRVFSEIGVNENE